MARKNASQRVWRPGHKKKNEVERDYSEYQNDSWAFLISFFRWYPDQLLDVIRADDAKYQNEELIQRVMERAFARYDYVDITGCRSLTKTTTVTKTLAVMNVLWPGTKSSYYGPSQKGQAKLARDAWSEIEGAYPILARHWRIDAMGKDTFGVSTEFGSQITINGRRGDNLHNVVAEEYAQEEPPAFDFEEYSAVILFAVRETHMVNGAPDPTYIPYQQRSITSAGRRQNHSYETRCNHLNIMRRGHGEAGERAFVMDVPWQIIVLSQMRPYRWAMQRKSESTPDKWTREMESRYTGTDSNPVVRDDDLTKSRCLLRMEEHHCCKDRDNRLAPQDVIYVVGYDVSYRDGKENAKCACVVTKLTRQEDYIRRNRYLKQVVWVEDWTPSDAPTPIAQAMRLKRVWARFCFNGSQTYIAVDSWQYGTAVLTALMGDLGDGLAPLCIYKHKQYTELELEGALPVIYPIKAGGLGTTDPDSDMVLYAGSQFENGNVQLLTARHSDGLTEFKRYHRIKDDRMDYSIYKPYKQTNILVNQIQNLKEVPSGTGIQEKRISHHIQRDYWSALKYSFRMAEILERENLEKKQRKSDWAALLDRYGKGQAADVRQNMTHGGSRLVTPRQGGRRT